MSDSLSFKSLLNRRVPFAGVVGNGRTCCLIDPRARIGWLCLPTFAHFPLFATLLDPVGGGQLELGIRADGIQLWSGDYGEFSQRYLPGTNILETTWIVATYHITIRDLMPWGQDRLIRDILIEGGQPAPVVSVRLHPTGPTPSHTRFRLSQAGIQIEEDRCAARGRLVCRAEVGNCTATRVDDKEIAYEFAPAGNHLTLVVEYEDHVTGQKPLASGTGDIIEQCSRSDAEWLGRTIRLELPDPEWSEAFERSLLALRLLTYEPTGAIIAAGTGSIPSEPAGDHNWDYRYCWVRDGAFAARAFDLAGCHTEAERLYRFLLDRESNGQWTNPLWAIEPSFPTGEEILAGLRGPAGEQPLRIGNAAAQQAQHDSPGNVISGVYDHCRLTGRTDLASDYWPAITRSADWCCDHWAEPESGIWERRDVQRLWVHGRALCWLALRDAVRLADLVNKPAPRRWHETLAEISRTLVGAGWSAEKDAILRACGGHSIYDVSVLALLLEGLVPANEPRLRRTVAALADHLGYGVAFRRDEDDERFPFYLATFWMIRAFQLVGEFDQAFAHLQSVVASTTNLGLMAEFFDPSSGRQYGNFPQAYSHEEMVQAILGMLFRWEEGRFVLFPTIPNDWVTTGNKMSVSNIPVGTRRAGIALNIESDILDFRTAGLEGQTVVIPSRYLHTGRRVRLDGEWKDGGE